MGAIQVSGYHTSTATARTGDTTVGGLTFNASPFGSSQTQMFVVIGVVAALAFVLIEKKKGRKNK